MLRTLAQSQPRRPPPPDPEVESLPSRLEQTDLPAVRKSKQASVLISAFLAICLTIGYNQCYGVFQEYYLSADQDVLDPAPWAEASPPTAMLAFVGTLAAGMNWMGSLAVTPLMSRIEHAAAAAARPTALQGTTTTPSFFFFFRRWRSRHRLEWVTLSGVVFMTAGFLLASFATRVWQILLTQGLLYGIGSSLLYFPLLSPAPEYFTRHRATAIGLILSGGGAGGLVLGPALRALLSAVGGRWALRALAALCLLLGVPIALSVPRSRQLLTAASVPPTRQKTRLPRDILVSPALLLSAAAAFCQSAGAQLPLAFIPTYSVALGLSAGTGATLLAVANAVNAVARVGTGYAGDRLGRLNALLVSLVAAALAVLALWGLSVKYSLAAAGAVPAASASSSLANTNTTTTSPAVRLWLAFVILYSVAAGGYYALFPATIADVFGIRNYAAVNGFIYFIRGCGTMVGSPVGGVLLSRDGRRGGQGYTDVVAWDGALLLGSVVCILGLRWVDAVGRGWAWRA